ncbi:hypothetical protein BGZ70_004728, partial [Mortierella alpina]
MSNPRNTSPPYIGGSASQSSAEKPRKRDKLRNLFRPAKQEEKAKVEDHHPETKVHDGRDASTDNASVVTSLKVSSLESASQLSELTRNMSEARLSVFSENVGRATTGIPLPSLDARIDRTPQLALCITLLPKNTASSLQSKGLETASDLTNKTSWTASTD